MQLTLDLQLLSSNAAAGARADHLRSPQMNHGFASVFCPSIIMKLMRKIYENVNVSLSASSLKSSFLTDIESKLILRVSYIFFGEENLKT